MGNSAEEAPDVLHVPADRIRESVRWRLRWPGQEEQLHREALEAATRHPDFTEADVAAVPAAVDAKLLEVNLWDALTADEIDSIAARFDLPREDLATLSRDLAVALNKVVRPISVTLPRETAIKRAQEAMRDAAEDILSASERMVRGIERLEALDTQAAGNRKGAARFTALLADYELVLQDIETLHRRLRFLAEAPDVALDLQPADKRKVPDLRRNEVLGCLFVFWSQAGRPLSVTTDPIDNSRRTGALVEFVNAVVRCLTDPRSDLSGDTIFTELVAFKRAQAK